MKQVESDCVSCGLPCLGKSCPHYEVEMYYCDICGEEYANFHMDGQDYCYDCAKNYFPEQFDDLTTSEKAEALKLDCEEIE